MKPAVGHEIGHEVGHEVASAIGIVFSPIRRRVTRLVVTFSSGFGSSVLLGLKCSMYRINRAFRCNLPIVYNMWI